MSNDLMNITLRVHRFTPRAAKERARGGSPFAKKSSPFGSSARKPRGKQWVQDYQLEVPADTTLLDCLLQIKREIDPSLAFRYSCGHGMCGSDAVAVNGTPTLLCTARIKDWCQPKTSATEEQYDAEGFRRTVAEEGSADAVTENDFEDENAGGTDGTGSADSGSANDWESSTEQVIELAALPGFPVQRDLIADIDPMLAQLKKLEPYLRANGVLATTVDGKVDVFEYLQKPEQLAKYEILSNCILCGVCEGACPVYAGGEAFMGPAALINAARFIDDSRDLHADERMDMIDSVDGIQACQSVRACSRECPKGIDVGEEIWQLIAQVKER